MSERKTRDDQIEAATERIFATWCGHGMTLASRHHAMTLARAAVEPLLDEVERLRARLNEMREKVRRVQACIEAGGANEELTAATALCSEILTVGELET
jgi:hypothetical protein